MTFVDTTEIQIGISSRWQIPHTGRLSQASSFAQLVGNGKLEALALTRDILLDSHISMRKLRQCQEALGDDMLITTGTCVKLVQNSWDAAWQTRARMDVTATVYAQPVDRQLSTASLPVDRAVDRHHSGPVCKLRHFGNNRPSVLIEASRLTEEGAAATKTHA